jgi:3-hydroxyisobutyrate dehydrogenase-like beta-hydroxyacid dehydrogenase
MLADRLTIVKGTRMTSSTNQDQGRTTLTAGVIGLGMIGGGAATNIAAAGIDLSVFDVRPDAADHLDGVDAPLATPADVALASDVVLVAVINAAQVKQVLTGEGGLLTAKKDGLTIVVLSTLAVSAIKEFAALCAEHGATLLDAGVTQAGEGKLVTMIGGPVEAVDHVRPVLDAFSKSVIHCGELGAGMVTKIARNVVTYSGWAVMREAVSIAVAGGVDPAVLLEVMESATAGGTSNLAMLQAQARGDGLPEAIIASTNVLAQKDLGAAQEFAAEVGITTPIADVVRPTMPDTLAGHFGEDLPDDSWERGIEVAKKVYGTALAERMKDAERTPAMVDTVEHLFGDIWTRGSLTTRDRRLLVLGATTMIGRQDLLEIQLAGAQENGEFTVAQLREMELFLNYYTSIENGGTFSGAANAVIAGQE